MTEPGGLFLGTLMGKFVKPLTGDEIRDFRRSAALQKAANEILARPNQRLKGKALRRYKRKAAKYPTPPALNKLPASPFAPVKGMAN